MRAEKPVNAVAQNIMPDVDQAIVEAIQDALRSADWTRLKGWDAVGAIADEVRPTSLVIYPEAMSVDGPKVVIPADLTVHLTYRGASKEAQEELDQTFPAVLRFSRKDSKITFDAIEADLISDLI